MTSRSANLLLVPVRCPDCARSDEQAVTALIVDGPGIRYMQVSGDEAAPGDMCGRPCPRCGKLWYVRILRAAA